MVTICHMYEATGTIKLINEVQSFASGFMKREFVVTTGDSRYPQDLKFEVVKDKCSVLDEFDAGQEVTVSFDIRGNEYNGKYFVNLSCWKLQPAASGGNSSEGQGGQKPSPRSAATGPRASGNSEPSPADLRKDEDFDDDDIPF